MKNDSGKRKQVSRLAKYYFYSLNKGPNKLNKSVKPQVQTLTDCVIFVSVSEDRAKPLSHVSRP